MKIFLVLLLFITIINGQDHLYANLVSSFHGCGKVPSGIGFSIKIGQCINDVASFLNPIENFDYQSYYFNLTQPEGNYTLLSLTLYNQENCNDVGINFMDLDIDTCNYQLKPVIQPFKGKIKGEDDLFYMVTISKQPEFPDNSYIYSVYDNSNSKNNTAGSSSSVCQEDNFIYAVTLSYDLEIEYSDPKNTTQTFSCDKNSIPSVVKCLNQKCSTSYTGSSCKQSKISSNYSEMVYCTK